MIIDNKLDFLRAQLTQTRLSHKNVSAELTQTVVTSTENKNIGMELFEDEAQAEAERKKKKKKEEEEKKEMSKKKEEVKICRNPLLLLRLL